MTTITLQDLDNRDADGQPYELTADHETIISYLDGPVRSDLTDLALATGLLDAAIDHLKADHLVPAASILDGFVIRLIVDGKVLERTCSSCGCTGRDCSQCIERTGQPCGWAGPDQCTACITS